MISAAVYLLFAEILAAPPVSPAWFLVAFALWMWIDDDTRSRTSADSSSTPTVVFRTELVCNYRKKPTLRNVGMCACMPAAAVVLCLLQLPLSCRMSLDNGAGGSLCVPKHI
uniref:Uncharacterized protein n=1 Tax=Zea mays TaxID=4577 RepID=A0A804R599_MAIZE